MIDWIEGHNDDPRFHYKVLVSHDGVYNLTSMTGATEELWFTDWEFKGTPWSNPAMYDRWSLHKLPGWVKVLLIIAIVVVLVVGIIGGGAYFRYRNKDALIVPSG